MKKYVLFAIFWLTACATSAPKEMTKVEAPVTAPSVKISGYTMDEISSSRGCPTVLAASGTEKEMMKWATACIHANQWKHVDELGNRLSMHFTNSPWGPYFLSTAAEHAKDWPRARWMIDLALKKAPNEGVILYQLGRVEWAMDDKESAYVTLQKSVEKNPTLVEAHVLMGQLALLTDRNSEAGKHFMRAIDHDAKHFGALMGLAEVGFRTRVWLDVEKYLRLAISAHPRSLQARMLLAEGQESLAKNYSAAFQTYREIQKLDKEHKLDASPSMTISNKMQVLQTNMAEELKRKISNRQPSDEGKVAK